MKREEIYRKKNEYNEDEHQAKEEEEGMNGEEADIKERKK